MAHIADPTTVIVRVATPGMPAFQLRKGEDGISVFAPSAVDPALSEDEVLGCFRHGSILIAISVADIGTRGLKLVRVEGAESLPARLRAAHHEIRLGDGMSRDEFKRALRGLEP